jgi:hypothetical protein
MNENEWEFHQQEQFGRAYNPNDCIIFSVSVHFPKGVVSINLLYSCYIFLFTLAPMTLYPLVSAKMQKYKEWNGKIKITGLISVCFATCVVMIVLICVKFFSFAQNALEICSVV